MQLHKKKIVLVLVAVLLVLTAILMLQKIDSGDIEIEGNTKYTKEELMKYVFTSRWDKNPYVLFIKTKFGKSKKIPFIDKYEVKVKSFNKVKITVYEKKITGYVKYMGSNMYFDKDGTIVESSPKELDSVPLVTGLTFDKIVLNEKLPIENDDMFNLILDVTQSLQKYDITVEKMYLSKEKEVKLYKNNVEVLVGNDKDMSDKIRTLRDIMPGLEGLKGTLDLREYNKSNSGYDFKVSQ